MAKTRRERATRRSVSGHGTGSQELPIHKDSKWRFVAIILL